MGGRPLLRIAGWFAGEGAVYLVFLCLLALVAEPLWRLLVAGSR
jgi:hypothetical protein